MKFDEYEKELIELDEKRWYLLGQTDLSRLLFILEFGQ